MNMPALSALDLSSCFRMWQGYGLGGSDAWRQPESPFLVVLSLPWAFAVHGDLL